MFYHIIYPLSERFFSLNVFRYITVRSFLAFAIALIFSILWGKTFIQWVKKHQFGQIVREDGPKEHYKKQGTPTFGGALIFSGLVLALGLCGNFSSVVLCCDLYCGHFIFSAGLYRR